MWVVAKKVMPHCFVVTENPSSVTSLGEFSGSCPPSETNCAGLIACRQDELSSSRLLISNRRHSNAADRRNSREEPSFVLDMSLSRSRQ